MWEVSPRSGLRYALLPLSAMGFEQASVGVWPTPSRTHLCCEDVLSRRGLRLPPECACRGAVAGGRTQSSAEKYVPDPTSEASVRARRPRNLEGPRGAVCRSQARAASDAQRPPGRRWPAGWRTEPRACCRAGSCEVCVARGTCDGAVGDCVRCTGPRGMCSYAVRNCDSAELRMSVPVGMIGASPFGSFPRNTCSVLAGEERSWEGGEGRVQAERPERESPPGQGNGPEGERSFDLYRSPDPGRRCPGECPEQVVQLRLTAC